MEHRAATWATKADRIKDLRRQKIATFKWNVYMTMHKYFWRFLWATKLAYIYSPLMCKLNLYRKYPDGRCGYCGGSHK